ncbi:flagellar protein FlgN [Paraneptunicella aestuarii]|uniref:flagella synthesis protein FlgN n=1 Tax=Paraneptunicella aestuarii TaxID=2831148 RepID=UPI001E3DB9C8|nr:flagellar protein FlgN [Paraneptunicella aestuarii]UAA39468.1 flagellar protein FlgN [Paraneptunicella aestuarii]
MSLTEVITQQIALLSKLKMLLDSELQLISTRDAEALLNLVEQKQKVLNEIQEQDQRISELYDPNKPQSDEVSALFEQAKSLLEDCKYSTEVNSKAVEQGQLRLEHLRKVLIEARNRESMTYDKSGRAQGGTALKGIKA